MEFATESDAAVEPVAGGVAVRTGAATHRAPQVVVAAGGWSKRLFPELGGSLWQCQQGIMYLEGVSAEFGRPAGVLSVKRIVHYLVEHFPAIVYNLPPDPKSVPHEAEGA